MIGKEILHYKIEKQIGQGGSPREILVLTVLITNRSIISPGKWAS